MVKSLKVYGGHLDGRHRYIVAAKSMAEAARQYLKYGVYTTYSICREFCTESANSKELELCLAKPGVVFRTLDKNEREYEEMMNIGD